MKSECIVDAVPFQRLLEAVKPSVGDICEGVYALICDAAYYTCGIAELPDAEHDRLHLHDISRFVKLHSTLMDLGAHWHMLCSAL